MPKDKAKMVKLECLEEHRVSEKELYEDGFGYVYEVDEAKAKELLALGKFKVVE